MLSRNKSIRRFVYEQTEARMHLQFNTTVCILPKYPRITDQRAEALWLVTIPKCSKFIARRHVAQKKNSACSVARLSSHERVSILQDHCRRDTVGQSTRYRGILRFPGHQSAGSAACLDRAEA